MPIFPFSSNFTPNTIDVSFSVESITAFAKVSVECMFHLYPNVFSLAFVFILPINRQMVAMSMAYSFVFISLQSCYCCSVSALFVVNSLSVGLYFCIISLLRSTTGLVAMSNRTCWNVYIIHLNNTNVSMLHLLFIFAFFIMLCLFLCIFLFSFRLVFVQALFAVWQPFRLYCFTLVFSVYMVFNGLM